MQPAQPQFQRVNPRRLKPDILSFVSRETIYQHKSYRTYYQVFHLPFLFLIDLQRPEARSAAQNSPTPTEWADD